MRSLNLAKELEMCRVCEVDVEEKDGGRRDEEDSIISARLVQFVTPAVVFNQPPRAACTANSLIIALLHSLCPCGQLQQMGALSRDPQPPPDPPTWGTSLTAHKHTQACTYCIHDACIATYHLSHTSISEYCVFCSF